LSPRPLSILLHSRAFYPQVGGLERVSEHLARELTNLGLQVTVLTDTLLGDAEELGPYRVVRSADAPTREALVRSAEIVHVNGFSVQLAKQAMMERKPIVWTHQGYQAVCPEGNLLHGAETCQGKRLRCFNLSIRHRGVTWAVRRHAEVAVRRLLLRAAAANVCVTSWVASRIRAPRSCVVWNPVDLEGLAPGSKAHGRGRFSFFGRLVPEKGVSQFLQALARCRGEGSAFTGRIVGDGPQRSALEEDTRRLGIAEAVSFEGTLTEGHLRVAQAEAWVVVVPSIWEEAFGLVAAEAMACGAPLLVSRDGGLREVAHGCALDFPNGDVGRLADEMTRIASDERLWGQLAAAGPAEASKFDARNASRQYLRLYGEVLS
jgi:glycosyltransferase involved in cell wall biosynthesis